MSDKKKLKGPSAPGRIEKLLHLKDLTDMARHFFTGCQVNIINAMNTKGNFYISNSFHFGKEETMNEDDEKANYSLGGTFVNKGLIMTGSMSTSGITQSILHYNGVGGGINIHAQVADHEKWVIESSILKNFKDFSFEIKLGSRELGIAFTQYLTPKLRYGSEILYLPPNKFRLVNILELGDNTDQKVTGVLNYGTDRTKFNLYYSRKMDNMNFLTSINTTVKNGALTSKAMMGYRVRHQMLHCKGMIDTTGSVGSIIEVAAGAMLSISISTHFNYFHDVYETGFGFTTGF
jgi:hypothetical protein